MVSTHGPFGLLNRSPKGSANGVWPLASPSAISLVRGSDAVYWLFARSVRSGRSPFLQMMLTCASSPSVQARKVHGWALVVGVTRVAATAPPVDVAVAAPAAAI